MSATVQQKTINTTTASGTQVDQKPSFFANAYRVFEKHAKPIGYTAAGVAVLGILGAAIKYYGTDEQKIDAPTFHPVVIALNTLVLIWSSYVGCKEGRSLRDFSLANTGGQSASAQAVNVPPSSGPSKLGPREELLAQLVREDRDFKPYNKPSATVRPPLLPRYATSSLSPQPL